MPSGVVGIDLSSHALDLVKLEEETNRAEWVRVPLWGKNAWERTLTLAEQFSEIGSEWFEDVYLVAVEEPYSAGQPGTLAILNRVVGAVMASLPYKLRCVERCWHVRPQEWKSGLGLKAKPTGADMHALGWRGFDIPGTTVPTYDQNARDAYCIARFARDENARGLAAVRLPDGQPLATGDCQ